MTERTPFKQDPEPDTDSDIDAAVVDALDAEPHEADPDEPVAGPEETL